MGVEIALVIEWYHMRMLTFPSLKSLRAIYRVQLQRRELSSGSVTLIDEENGMV